MITSLFSSHISPSTSTSQDIHLQEWDIVERLGLKRNFTFLALWNCMLNEKPPLKPEKVRVHNPRNPHSFQCSEALQSPPRHLLSQVFNTSPLLSQSTMPSTAVSAGIRGRAQARNCFMPLQSFGSN